MIYLIIIISFFLEGLSSMIFGNAFFSLFTLISLVVTYPYFIKYNSFFWKTCLLIGFCYDIIFTNTMFVHAFLFYILGYLIAFLYRFFDYKIWNVLLVNFVIIISYQILSFILFVLSSRISFSLLHLGNVIFPSLISNFLYIIILYGILFLLNKYKKVTLSH